MSRISPFRHGVYSVEDGGAGICKSLLISRVQEFLTRGV
jgi:hypothetical protein